MLSYFLFLFLKLAIKLLYTIVQGILVNLPVTIQHDTIKAKQEKYYCQQQTIQSTQTLFYKIIQYIVK